MRKPSYRGVEWVKYQRGIEIAPIGECCTRNKTTIKDFFVEPLGMAFFITGIKLSE